MYAGGGSGGSRFRKVPEGWFRKVVEGSGGFRRVPARVGVGSGGRVRNVPEGSEEFRRVLAYVLEARFRFRRVPVCLLQGNVDRSSHVIVLITGITLSTWAKPLRKKAPM